MLELTPLTVGILLPFHSRLTGSMYIVYARRAREYKPNGSQTHTHIHSWNKSAFIGWRLFRFNSDERFATEVKGVKNIAMPRKIENSTIVDTFVLYLFADLDTIRSIRNWILLTNYRFRERKKTKSLMSLKLIRSICCVPRFELGYSHPVWDRLNERKGDAAIAVDDDENT